MTTKHPGRSSSDTGISVRRAMRLALAALLGAQVFVGALAPTASAAPGDLDTTFGSGGIVANSSGNPVDVAVQSDGKIVAVGKHEVCAPSGGEVICHDEFLVERFNENGTPDTSFGGGDGIVTTSFGHEDQKASSIAIEPSGKLLVGGDAGGEFALARYSSDGSLDASFGSGDGEVTAAVPSGYGFRSYSGSMALLPSGQIILGGSTYSEAPGEWKEWEPWHMVVARFNSDGTLDTTYGTNGAVIGPKGNMYGLAADGIGRALAVGWSNHEFAVARFTSSGSLDTSFGGSGLIKMNLAATGSKATGVLVQPDGKIVASGYGNAGMTVARFNENGSLDALFGGGDGIATPTFASPCCVPGSAIALALQPDGRIVLAGQWRPNEEFKDEWAVARLYASGTPDKTFGTDGLVTNAFEGGAYEDYASGVALQADGKIVAVGSSGSPNYDFGMMRFLGGGSVSLPSYHRLVIQNSDPANGRVSAPDLYCGYNCAADYEAGETIEVRAEGEYEFNGTEWTQVPFTGWATISGNPGTCTGTTTPCEVTMNGDVELVATFDSSEPPTLKRELTISKAGTGTGTVSSVPVGIDCGATCSHAFDEGTSITLTAIPAAGSTFAGWSGGGCSEMETCQVTMNADTTITAAFIASETGGSGGGSGGNFGSGGGSTGGTTLPNTILGAHPPAKLTTKSAKAKVKFRFSSSTPGATFKCKLDKQPFKLCRSPKTYKVKPGRHVFKVEAADAAGADATPVSYRFKVVRRR